MAGWIYRDSGDTAPYMGGTYNVHSFQQDNVYYIDVTLAT